MKKISLLWLSLFVVVGLTACKESQPQVTTYTVNFVLDNETTVDPAIIEDGAMIPVPTSPTKDGYSFIGWYIDDDYETQWVFDVDTVTQDITLYAKWRVDVDYTTTFKVLSIGNSFSEDAQRYLWNIAASYGVDSANIVVANMYIGGCDLETHVENITSGAGAYQFQLYTSSIINTTSGYSLYQGITYEDWDVITLQQVSSDSGVLESYSDYVETLVYYINAISTNKDVQIYWHMTWAYQQDSSHTGFLNYSSDQTIMYNAILDTVNTKILSNNDIVDVIPNATAVQNARTSYIGDHLTRDGYHLSDPFGRYIAGLMFFKQITGFVLSPETITYKPSGVTDALQLIALESVNNAYQAPYEITISNYSSIE